MMLIFLTLEFTMPSRSNLSIRLSHLSKAITDNTLTRAIKKHPYVAAAIGLGLLFAAVAVAAVVIFPPAAFLFLPAFIAASPAVLTTAAVVGGLVLGGLIAGAARVAGLIYNKVNAHKSIEKQAKQLLREENPTGSDEDTQNSSTVMKAKGLARNSVEIVDVTTNTQLPPKEEKSRVCFSLLNCFRNTGKISAAPSTSVSNHTGKPIDVSKTDEESVNIEAPGM